MIYNGSAYDSGQMASSQSVCRPAPGPTSWLGDTQSKHHSQQQQQYQRENGEPVPLRVMTNGTCDPGERSDTYMRPFGAAQPEPACPPHLDFLYERAQKPVQSPTACPNGLVGMTSPRADEYRSLSRAVPAPVHLHQQQSSPGARMSADASSSSPVYTPFNRATPAPIQQHAAAVSPVGPQRPTTGSGTPTSPRATQLTQHQNLEPPDAQVSRQLSQLGFTVADGQQQQSPQRTSAPVPIHPGSRPVGGHHRVVVGRQPPASAFVRRLSAPGPVGQTGEPGPRKPWSYTPAFGVGCAANRVAPTQSRPVMQPMSQNAIRRSIATEGLQSNDGADCSSQRSTADTSSSLRRDAVDGASIRYKLREGEDPIADYDETSIRYRGRANPSKTFRLLQSATGSDSDSDSALAYATARRPRRQQSREVLTDHHHHQQQQQPHADDIVDISYVGAHIPSRTFRILQQAVGVTSTPPENGSIAQSDEVSGEGDDSSPSLGSRRNVRVIHLRPFKKHPSVDNILAYTDL